MCPQWKCPCPRPPQGQCQGPQALAYTAKLAIAFEHYRGLVPGPRASACEKVKLHSWSQGCWARGHGKVWQQPVKNWPTIQSSLTAQPWINPHTTALLGPALNSSISRSHFLQVLCSQKPSNPPGWKTVSHPTFLQYRCQTLGLAGWRYVSLWHWKGQGMDSSLFSSVQSLSCVRLFVIPRTAERQASLSVTKSRSLLKLMSIETVMPSIQPSHPLSPPSTLALNLSQLQGLF